MSHIQLRGGHCAFVSYLQQSRQQVDPLCVQPDGGKEERSFVLGLLTGELRTDNESKCRGREFLNVAILSFMVKLHVTNQKSREYPTFLCSLME